MRWLVALSVFWVACAHGQERLDFQIQLIAVVPVDASGIQRESLEYTMTPGEAIGMVHEAVEMLGIHPGEYSVTPRDEIKIMRCETPLPTDEGAQYCYFPSSEERFDLNDRDSNNINYDQGDTLQLPGQSGQEIFRQGTYTITLLLIPQRFALAKKTYSGLANWFSWNNGTHWQDRSCSAWANTLQGESIVAHELGHCLGLQHNDEDGSTVQDLMRPCSCGYTYLHLENAGKIRAALSSDLGLTTRPSSLPTSYGSDY